MECDANDVTKYQVAERGSSNRRGFRGDPLRHAGCVRHFDGLSDAGGRFVERVESSKHFSALLPFAIFVFVAPVPGGLLCERTLHTRALLSDQGEAGTIYPGGFPVADGFSHRELSGDPV